MRPKERLSRQLKEADTKTAFASFVGPDKDGQTLVEFLSKRFTYFAAELWEKHIQSGDVLLNNLQVEPQQRITRGDEVKYLAMTRPEPKIPTSAPVIFEDADLLVVNKPAHIPMHPSGRYLRNTLINLLKKQRKIETLFLAHRLDRETSGVVILTKTHFAKEKMYWQFFNSEIEKTYWALVWGIPQPLSGTVDEPLGPAKPGQSSIRIKQMVNGLDAKACRTKYHTLSTKLIEAPHWQPPQWPGLEAALRAKKLEKGPPWPVSLVEARPITGRTNQIRVHLAHQGAGILGDKLYDPEERVFFAMKESKAREQDDKRPGYMNLGPELMRRLVLEAHALHAKRLKIRHPRTGKALILEAPLPTEWQGLYTLPKNLSGS